MKVRILVAATLAVVLTLAWTTASAKCLDDVTISGPGLPSAIRLSDHSANELARQSGSFGQTPDRFTADPPAGALGPRYAATYACRLGQNEPSTLRQDLYPFADVGPVTYTSRGGWSRAGPELALLLVAAGVPVPASYAAPVPVVEAPRLTG